MAFVMVLSYSRLIFLRFFLDARMDSFLRGYVEGFCAFTGVARVVPQPFRKLGLQALRLLLAVTVTDRVVHIALVRHLRMVSLHPLIEGWPASTVLAAQRQLLGR